jgi:hypothetical protein
MKMARIRICMCLCALASCHRGEPPVKTERPPDKQEAATAPPLKVDTTSKSAPKEPQADAFPACEGLGFRFELKGLSQARVLERFGPPKERESYRAGDRGGEFYVAIESAYPSKVSANRDVPIEEWTWTSGECILTVWFHRPSGEWVALDDIYRNEEVAF